MTACCNLAMPIPRQKAAEAAAETTSAAISVQHLQMSFSILRENPPANLYGAVEPLHFLLVG